MKRSSLALIAAVVLLVSASYAPQAHAIGFSTLIDYYDSNLNNVGTSFRSCSGSLQTWGTLAGEWKEVTYHDCLTDEITYYDYHYCSGTWVLVGYIGDPSC